MAIKLEDVHAANDYLFIHSGQTLNSNEDYSASIHLGQKTNKQISSKTMPQISKDRLKNYLMELSDKYFLKFDDALLEELIKKLGRINEEFLKFRYMRETAAILVFCQYSDIFGLNVKEFCSRNSLQKTVFFKRYRIYQQYLKQQRLSLQFDEQTKNSSEEQDEDYIYIVEPNNFSDPTQAISAVYDRIFKTHYFQTNRRQLIQKLAERFKENSSILYYKIDWTGNYSLKTFYLVYAFFKYLGVKISIPDFCEDIYIKSGLSLKKQKMLETMNMFKESQKNKQERDPLFKNYQNLNYQEQEVDLFQF